MKRIACLLPGVVLALAGCVGVQHVEPALVPAKAPAEPPPPPVLPGQVTEANAPEVIQALGEELDRATAEGAATAAPVPVPIPRQ